MSPRLKVVCEMDANYLRSIMSYSRTTGCLTWKANLGCRAVAGNVAGSRQNNGYVSVKIHRIFYTAHRLAWLYVTGAWPKQDIDHKNGVRWDNRWNNLRLATRSQNKGNAKLRCDSKTGFKGVNWHKQMGKYQAYIYIEGKSNRLGWFDTPEAAHAAYIVAAKKHFGEFARAS